MTFSAPLRLCALCALVSVSPTAGQPAADELVQKNIRARGGEAALRALNSMRLSGKVVAQGLELPMVILAKRPNLMRQEVQIQDGIIITAFDGATAWMINPAMGSDAPHALSGPEGDLAREQSDFDPVLLDYARKGHQVEVVVGAGIDGVERLPDGTAVHHLKVTRQSGRVQHHYLDAGSGLEVKTTTEMTRPDGGTITIEHEMADYREVRGLMVPHTLRNRVNGTLTATMIVEKVEVNPPIEDSLFRMPARRD